MSRSRAAPATLALLLLLAGCAAGAAHGAPAEPQAGLGGFLARLFGRGPAAPAPSLRYVVGDPYQRGGVWHYPRADFTLDQTGLAAVAPARRGLTADGEAFDATALEAAHATLQLPSIVLVTNLENGRAVLLRVNDRGPAAPGRVLALSPRAAELIGARDGTQLRLQVQESESRQLAAALGGNGPRLDVAAAPTAGITTEPLAAPGGGPAARPRPSAAPNLPSAAPEAAPVAVAARLPERVMQMAAQPGRLFIDAGAFSQAQYARMLAGRLGGDWGGTQGAEVVTDYAAPRDRAYQVRLGPFGTVAEADGALDRARRAGVTDGRIIVQP